MKLTLAFALLAIAPTFGATASDAEIRALLENRIVTAKKAVGIAVGVLDAKGQRVIGAGKKSDQQPQAPDGDTVFEIGSITKVFTATLLADMVVRGEVKLDDPVSKYLPDSVKIPSYNGRVITLYDLTTQTSGLPRMPTNFHPADLENPYADYTVDQLYTFLSGLSLTRSPGEKYEYSNLGVGLLGQALSHRANQSYEQLVTERILKPLGMTRTSITLSAAQKANFAHGYDPSLAPTKNWDLPTFAGAGAIRSTVNDMLKFLSAELGLTKSPLSKAMEMTQAMQKPTGMKDIDIGMGWHINSKYNTSVIWHNGGTGGYRTWAGFEKSTKSAVVVLCNTSFGVDDLGLHFLVTSYPAPMLEAPPHEVTLDPAVLAKLTGHYVLAPTFAINVTEEGGKLWAQATGQPRFQLFAKSDTEFFLKVVEASVTFEKDASGNVTDLILHQNGANQKAKREPLEK
ncbi:MAG TPA: serine hydrolase [Bryobacteraceae bacterium]|jgi:CubicO group peptidase (beta-lactamase class C family)